MSWGAVVGDVIRSQARTFKMPGIVRAYERLGRQAREEHRTHEEYLHEVVAAEVASRAESALGNCVRDACFPEPKALDTFDFQASGGVDAAQVAALGLEATRQRRRVAFWRAEDLVRVLVEARDKRELSPLERRLGSVDLLVLDDVGFVPFDREGGELLFNLVADRYERRSVGGPKKSWASHRRPVDRLHSGAMDDFQSGGTSGPAAQSAQPPVDVANERASLEAWVRHPWGVAGWSGQSGRCPVENVLSPLRGAWTFTGGNMPIRSVEYGEEAVRVVVLGQLTRPDLELIREGLSRGPGGHHVVIDLRHAPVPDAGALLGLAGLLRDTRTRTEVVGISRTSERLLAHLGVDLAADRSS